MQHPIIPVAAFAAAVLVFIPFVLQRTLVRNLPLVAVAIWMSLANVIRGVNSLVWAGSIATRVPVWCDISASTPFINRTLALTLGTLYSDQDSNWLPIRTPRRVVLRCIEAKSGRFSARCPRPPLGTGGTEDCDLRGRHVRGHATPCHDSTYVLLHCYTWFTNSHMFQIWLYKITVSTSSRTWGAFQARLPPSPPRSFGCPPSLWERSHSLCAVSFQFRGLSSPETDRSPSGASWRNVVGPNRGWLAAYLERFDPSLNVYLFLSQTMVVLSLSCLSVAVIITTVVESSLRSSIPEESRAWSRIDAFCFENLGALSKRNQLFCWWALLAAALSFCLWFAALPAAEAGDRVLQRIARRIRRRGSSDETVISLQDWELAKRCAMRRCSDMFTDLFHCW